MTVRFDKFPFIALIDDDSHSAHLLMRMLEAHGAPEIRHLGGAVAGRAALQVNLSNFDATWPSLLIIDLKAHSSANLDFARAMQQLLRQKGLPFVVMSQPLDQAGRDLLYDAGVAAIFCREAELSAYRREAAGIVSFWARHERLNAVGM